tara:strand:- start:130 stop:525 length:396 start_codon:yes stop_codon:yes gene_type:complete
MIENNKYSKIKISSNKNFGITFTIIFILIALYPLLKSKSVNYFFILISILVLFITFFFPTWLNKPNKAWFKLGIFLSNYIATPIIMFFIFFGIVTPIGIILNFFSRKQNKKKISSWIVRTEDLSKEMTNQF